MATHALFSPSASKRWLSCPGSIGLTAKVPPELLGRESVHAAEGTKGHACLEFLIKNRHKLKAALAFCRKTYGEEMTRYALAALQEIIKRTPKGAEVLSETEACLRHIHVNFFGTCDCAIIEIFGRLTVADYKYGAGIPVEAIDNTQMLAYALGIAHRYHYNFTEVCMAIIQPRAEPTKEMIERGDTGPVREWVITIDQLIEWAKKFERGIKACEKPNAPLKYGADWCRFCPAAHQCPELSTKAFESAGVDFNEDTQAVKLPVLPPASAVSTEQVGRALVAYEKIEAWGAQLRKLAFDLLNRGVPVPGYKLVAKESRRKWINSELAAKEATKLFGEAAFEPLSLLSPAQMEKLGAKAKDFTKARAAKVSTGVTMVPESDPRHPTTRAEIDFAGE